MTKTPTLTALKPANRSEHNYVYNEVDLQTEYQAPEIGLSSHETLESLIWTNKSLVSRARTIRLLISTMIVVDG